MTHYFWAVVGVLYALGSLIALLIAMRFFIEWLDERAYKPRMRTGK
jgi:hypothetical protein